MSSISVLVTLAVLLESVCLGILYVNNSLRGKDNSSFANEHLLTRLFVSAPAASAGLPLGVHFLGYFPQTRLSFSEPDDLLGYRLPTTSAVVELDHSNKYLYITDDNGFIVDVNDPPVTLQKPVETYRVIVLGGSTVMGTGAPRPSQNIVGMLRKAVRERGLTGPNGKRVEFINAGVHAYTSAQEYLYFVADLLRFKPDLAVVYDGWNDSVFDYAFRDIADRNAERLAQSYSIAGSARLLAENLRYFLTQSDFRLAMAESLSRAFLGLSNHVSSYLSYKPDAIQTQFVSKPFDPRVMENYRRNHRAFLALADDQLSVALFLQPLVGTDDRALSAEEKASWRYSQFWLGDRIPFYEHARQILEDLKERNLDNGHYCIADLSHSLKDVSETVYADSGHLLPNGNEVVAAHILDELVSCGLLNVASAWLPR
jgi:hypothetical protein